MSLPDKHNHRRTPARQRDLAFEESYLDFTETLCAALGKSGQSQADLARALGKPASFINRILRRKTNPGLRTLTDLAQASGMALRFSLTQLDENGLATVVELRPAEQTVDYTNCVYLSSSFVPVDQGASGPVRLGPMTRSAPNLDFGTPVTVAGASLAYPRELDCG